MRDIARTYNVSHSPISRLAAQAGTSHKRSAPMALSPELNASLTTSSSPNQQARLGHHGPTVRQQSARASSFASGR
ncbi:MAG: hypothetical protein POH28_12535 [Acidocella sp.]|nr:hypothetical protein [Acidocella sp.]